MNSKYNDIIFIMVIVFLLFIPFSKLNTTRDLPLKNENRNANRFPKWRPNIVDDSSSESKYKIVKEVGGGGNIIDIDFEAIKTKREINNKYLNNINSYIGDRIGFRFDLLQFKQSLVYKLFKKPMNYQLILKDEWIYENVPPNNFEEMDITKLPLILANIVKLQDYCERNHIKCYIVNVPDSHYLIRENLGLPNDLLEKSDMGEQLKQYLKENNVDFPIIPMQKYWAEQNKKEHNIYYKTDMHNTNTATWIEYNKIMEIMKIDFPNIVPLKENDFDIYYSKYYNNGNTPLEDIHLVGSQCDRYQIKPCPLNTFNKYYRFKERENVKVNRTYNQTYTDGTYQEYIYAKGIDLRVAKIGTSFSFNYDIFYPGTFKHYLSMTSNQGNLKKYCPSSPCNSIKIYDNILKEFKPDIFIIQVVNIYNLLDLWL